MNRRDGGNYTVEVRCQALRRTWGLIDHYFLVIGEHEYHVGGSYSKGAHTIAIKTLCSACYTRTVESYRLCEDRRLFDRQLRDTVHRTESTGTGLAGRPVRPQPTVARPSFVGRNTHSLHGGASLGQQ